jgi:hypothetical protein
LGGSLWKDLMRRHLARGAVKAIRDALNEAYYGKEVTPTDIFIRRAVTNTQSAGLIAAVAKAADGE